MGIEAEDAEGFCSLLESMREAQTQAEELRYLELRDMNAGAQRHAVASSSSMHHHQGPEDAETLRLVAELEQERLDAELAQ
eukprot:1335164-Rhodomonas_salina.2